VTDASTSQPDLTDADGSVDEAPLSDTDVSMADQDVDASLDAETDVEAHPDAGAADAPADVDAGAGADVDGDLDDGGTAAAGDGGSDEDDDSAESDMDRLENEGDIAADYLEELLDIADLDGDLDMDVEGDRAAVSIVGGDVRQLVGRNGEVLEALQELTRLAVYRETGERSRLMLDVGGFRADKRSRLEKVAAEAVDEVKRSGERKSLEPMSPFERKVVHDVVAAAGLYSSSEGEEPRRYVVVLPA
jgi:spoIIIJ-associated protein